MAVLDCPASAPVCACGAANDNYYENEGTIIINGGNIHAKGQQGSSAIGGSYQDRNVSSDGDSPAISGKAAASPSTAASSVPS